MNLLRFIGRSLLAGFFVTNGLKAVRRPDALVDAAEPIVERLTPLAERILPDSTISFLPQDTRSLVRANGAAQVVGGLAIFTGIGRRAGAGIAAASMVPHVMASNPIGASSSQRATQRSLFVRNLALLGAALVVSQDTQGSPSLLWLAKDRHRRQKIEADKKSLALDSPVRRRCCRRAKTSAATGPIEVAA